MNKFMINLLFILCLIISSPLTQANEWHYGFELAYFTLNTESVDDPDNLGLLAGYSWDISYGSIALEAEATSTFEKGLAGRQDASIDTGGLYAAYRSRSMGTKNMGPYFKLKAGSSYSNVLIGNTRKHDSDLSAGFGFGINMKSVAFELDYTYITDDIDMFNLLVLF